GDNRQISSLRRPQKSSTTTAARCAAGHPEALPGRRPSPEGPAQAEVRSPVRPRQKCYGRLWSPAPRPQERGAPNSCSPTLLPKTYSQNPPLRLQQPYTIDPSKDSSALFSLAGPGLGI